MANRTVKDAHSIKGTNPQYLIEKIIRSRIYECRYWKEECFALSAELLVDKAMGLRYVGGVVDGNIKPTPFLCLILKMLQIQPEKDIVVEFISQHDFKYVRALGAFYMRLTGSSLDSYKYLEPLYLDYRKLRRLNKTGVFELVHVDEFVDELLREERLCDIILPRIQKRLVHEENNQLEARVSALDDDIGEIEEDEDDDDDDGLNKDRTVVPPAPDRHQTSRDWDHPHTSPTPRYRRSRSPLQRRPMMSREVDHRDRRDHNGRDAHHAGRDAHHGARDTHHREKERHRESRHHRHRHHRSRSREKTKSSSSGHRHRHEHDNPDDRHARSGRKSRKDDDVSEANELRAKLGIAPLRP